jgi:hypothetical protein
MTVLVDQWGQPLRREIMTQEIAASTTTGARRSRAIRPTA